MPVKNVQTNLTIAMQTKGFEKGLRDMLGISQKTMEGLKKQSAQYGEVQDRIKGMQARVQELAKVQLSAGAALEKINDKTSDAYKAQSESMKTASKEAQKLRKEVRLLEQAHKGDADAQGKMVNAQQKLMANQKQQQQQARGGFGQGFMQTAMPGMASMFLQRGPGMMRQAGGQMLGGMARRAGRFGAGLGQAAFTGVGGLQQALGAIPLVGGVAAGQLGAVAGHSQQALQWQQQRLQMAPFMETGMSGRDRRQLGGVEQGLQGVKQSRKIADFARRMAAAPKSAELAEDPSRAMMARMGMIAPGRKKVISTFLTEEEKEQDPTRRQLKIISDAEKQVDVREKKLLAQRREIRARTPMGQIAGAGRELLGVGRQEAAQRTAQLFQVGGGRFTGGAGQQQQVKAAFAAQTMYGVGPEAAGGFLQAGRRGGLVGGRGRGMEAMTEGIGDALRLGLEGSEITQYLQQMAQGIQQFQATGIPFNKDSISSMATEFGKAGIGGPRGAAMAGGMQQYVQGIGQRGISSGIDLMAMQAFGGFSGGGPQDYEQAILQMESMQGVGAGGIEAGTPMGDMAKKLIEMGGGARGGGATFLRGAMGRMGVKMGMGEAMALTERVTGEKTSLTPEQREAAGIDVAGEAVRRGGGRKEAAKVATVDQLVKAAANRVNALGPNLKMQASIMDKQLAVGQKALEAVQNLELSSLNVNQAFITMAGPALNGFSETMLSLTAELNKLVKSEGGVIAAIGKMIKNQVIGT